MTSKGFLLLSIALAGAGALAGAIAIDSARLPSPPVITVDLTRIAVEPARPSDPATASLQASVPVVLPERMPLVLPAPSEEGSVLTRFLFGTAFAAVPRLPEPVPSAAAIDGWNGALQQVAPVVPDTAVPGVVPVSLSFGGTEAARADSIARLSDPERPDGALPVATPPAQATAPSPLAPAEARGDTTSVAIGTGLVTPEPAAAPAVGAVSHPAEPVVVASLDPAPKIPAASVANPASVAEVAPAPAAPVPVAAAQAGPDQAVVAADALRAVLPAPARSSSVWAQPRSSLVRVARPVPETPERLDVALARAVSLIEPVGAPWLRSAEKDGTGRRLTGCGPGDLACSTFVSGRGEAFDQPSPLLVRYGDAPLTIGGIALPDTGPEAERALRCLAFTAYTEAGNQGTRGMAAVVWVVMNRVAMADDFGESPCEVLADPGQFEPLRRPRFRAFTKALRAGDMPPFPAPLNPQDEILLRTARLVVWQMLDGYFADDPTDGAQYFLAPAAMRALGRGTPDWTNRFARTASIGDHVFYRSKRRAR